MTRIKRFKKKLSTLNSLASLVSLVSRRSGRRSGQLSTPFGFTLIEIIVVFSVITVISTVGLASFVNYSRSQSVNTAAYDVLTMFNKAKSMSMSQTIQDSANQSMCPSGAFSGYKVLICGIAGSTCIDNNIDTFELNIACNDSIDNPNNPIESGSLPANVHFLDDPAYTTSTSYLFRPIVGAVNGAGKVRLIGYGIAKDVSVDGLGNIKAGTGIIGPSSTPTPTGAAPTVTPTPTPTGAVPTATLTPTPTGVPPTSTPTPTPTPTNTPTPTPTPTSTPIPTPTPTSVPTKKVFATSLAYNGNLGGLSGADLKCQALGPAGPTWRAWVSSSGGNAKDRITDSKYVKINNSSVVVADSKADLTDGSIATGINWDQNGTTVSGYVWTGTKVDGTVSTITCTNWTTQASWTNGTIGVIGSTSGTWTNNLTNGKCDVSYRLYCFEQ